MAFPTPATKNNCDASTDDPKQALLTDLAQLVDKFNLLLAAAAAAGPLSASGITGAAPLASPALTGAPTAPTAATADNSTLLATTALVTAKIAAIPAPAASVDLTTAQTIGGVKTFSSRPVVPAGVGSGDAVNVGQAFGIGQTFQTVTRTSGVTYTNSTTKPRFGSVSWTSTQNTSSVSLSINGGAAITIGQSYAGGTSYTGGTASYIIQPGESYVLNYVGTGFTATNSERF